MIISDLYMNKTTMYGTFLGKEGLKSALLYVLCAIINKIAWGILYGIMLSCLFTFIKLVLNLNRIKKSKNNEKKKEDKTSIVNIKLVIIVMLIYCTFSQGSALIYNNKKKIETYSNAQIINSDFSVLYNIIKDFVQMETEELEVMNYKIEQLNYKEITSRRRIRTARKEWYIMFYNTEYIVISQKDEKMIDYYMNYNDEKNYITVFKNSGLINSINGENKQVSDEIINNAKMDKLKNMIKISIDENGRVKRNETSMMIDKSIIGMRYEILKDDERIGIVNCYWELDFNVQDYISESGKYKIQVIATDKSMNEFQVGNEIEFEFIK